MSVGGLRALLGSAEPFRAPSQGTAGFFHRETPPRQCAVAENSEGRTRSAFVSDLVI